MVEKKILLRGANNSWKVDINISKPLPGVAENWYGL